MKKLKLIKTDSIKESSNFWNSCKRKLDEFPTIPCIEGKPELDKDQKLVKSPKCPWWINSKDHNYCFWKFVKDKSNKDGQMKEVAQIDLAKLFGWSNTKAHHMIKEAMIELVEVFEKHGFIEEIDLIIEELEYYQTSSDIVPQSTD